MPLSNFMEEGKKTFCISNISLGEIVPKHKFKLTTA